MKSDDGTDAKPTVERILTPRPLSRSALAADQVSFPFPPRRVVGNKLGGDELLLAPEPPSAWACSILMFVGPQSDKTRVVR